MYLFACSDADYGALQSDNEAEKKRVKEDIIKCNFWIDYRNVRYFLRMFHREKVRIFEGVFKECRKFQY